MRRQSDDSSRIDRGALGRFGGGSLAVIPTNVGMSHASGLGINAWLQTHTSGSWRTWPTAGTLAPQSHSIGMNLWKFKWPRSAAFSFQKSRNCLHLPVGGVFWPFGHVLLTSKVRPSKVTLPRSVVRRMKMIMPSGFW